MRRKKLYYSFAMMKIVSRHEISTRGQCGTVMHLSVRESCFDLVEYILKVYHFETNLV